MHLSHFAGTNHRFESPLASLIQLARRHRYNYDDYHAFFTYFIELLDAGSYSLSMAEFAFYLRRLLQASVPTTKAIDWCHGSLMDIDRHLSAISDNDLVQLTDYFFSKQYAQLTAALMERRATTPNKKTQVRACILVDIIENFTCLLKRQLQARNLSVKHDCLPKITESPRINNKTHAQYLSLELSTRVIVSQLLSDLGFENLEHIELAGCLVNASHDHEASTKNSRLPRQKAVTRPWLWLQEKTIRGKEKQKC